MNCMFTIHTKPPAQLDSPVADLINLIPNAIDNISPERREEFKREYPDFDIFVEDCDNWVFKADGPGRKIIVSLFCMEVLWATAYAHTLLYQRMIGGRVPDNKFALGALKTPECREACALLKWITERRLGISSQRAWPANLPRPTDTEDPGDQRKLATEIALGALGFIFHHELSHIRLLHSGTSEIDPERDADHAAVDWILRDGEISNTSLADKKRLLSLAHALSVTVVRDIYTGDFDGDTHPRSFDRLDYALSRHLTDKNHLCRSFIAFVLKLHMDNSPVQYWEKTKEFTDFDDIIQTFIDAFADFSERSAR